MSDSSSTSRRTVLKSLGSGAAATVAGAGSALASGDAGTQDQTQCETVWSRWNECSMIKTKQFDSSVFEIEFDLTNNSQNPTTVKYGTGSEGGEYDRTVELAPDEQHSDTITVQSGEDTWSLFIGADSYHCLEYAAVRECSSI